jgi:hypothetical protein
MIRMIESRRLRWAGHVARMGGEKDCIYNFGRKVKKKETTRKT